MVAEARVDGPEARVDGTKARVDGPEARVDGRRARGDATRRAILRRAMELAAADGLEGVSLGRLASDLGMSKSGLFAHFDSKEELQLATLRAARRFFARHAIDPAQAQPEGLARLTALVEAWLTYLGVDAPEGGCLFIEGAAEYNGRTGPVRDMIAETMGQWLGLLTEQARIAVERGEIDADPERLAWELHAFGLALNWDRQLNSRPEALERARAAAHARLGRATGG
jgi:AcrR family transcriptional regulator